MQCQQLNVILVGKTGSGKSASGNTILGREIFVSKLSGNSTTKNITCDSVTVGDVSLTVYDTPGLFDTERTNKEVCHQWNHVLQLEQSSPTVYLLVIEPGRFTEEERKSVHHIETFLGESRLKNTWILFTRGDELEEGGTLEKFIAEIPELKKTVQRFEGRYHIFNNKAMGNREQVGRLIEKIQKGHHFTTPSLQVPSLQPASPHQPSSLPERRLMLLGKTGMGKSASGNTILGQDVFESMMDLKSVTYESKRGQSVVAGRQVFVVDTPGLFDTQLSHGAFAEELGRAVYDSSPGVHALLITLQVGTFTAQEKQVIDLIKVLFGEGALKYAVILFTHGDKLEGRDIHPLIEDCKDISDLVQQCGGRYHVLDNKDRRNTSQVTALLKTIDKMMEENGGSYYTNEMFQDAAQERAREQAEAERCEREKEEQKERKHQMEIERATKAAEERVRKEYEEENNRLGGENQEMEAETRERKGEERGRKDRGLTQFLARHWVKLMAAEGIGTGVCAGIGTGIGVVGGPVGMAIGAGVGAAVGAVGVAVGAVVASQLEEEKVPLLEADHLEMQNIC